MPLQTHARPRRAPQQARSKATVDAVLDATARILVAEGYARASTNRIAQAAGVSIGSLYQFFPSKAALVIALRRRHAEQMRAMVRDMAGAVVDAPLAEAVPKFVHAVVTAHLIDPQLHRMLEQEVPRRDLADGREDIDAEFRAMITQILVARRHEILSADPELTSLILVRLLDALVHTAVLGEHGTLSAHAIEHEISKVILRYLQGVA